MTDLGQRWIVAWEPVRRPNPDKALTVLFESIHSTQEEAQAACQRLNEEASSDNRYHVASWPHEHDPEPNSIIEIEDGIARPYVPSPPKWVIAESIHSNPQHPQYQYYSGYDSEDGAKAALDQFNIDATARYEIAYWPHDIIPDEGAYLTIEGGVARHYKQSPFQYKQSLCSLYQSFELHDGDRRYALVANIQIGKHQDLDHLAQLGPDWFEDEAVLLFKHDPPPISKGDVAEIMELDSTLSTYQFDGNSFIQAPMDILHPNTPKQSKPSHKPVTNSPEPIKKTKKHQL